MPPLIKNIGIHDKGVGVGDNPRSRTLVWRLQLILTLVKSSKRCNSLTSSSSFQIHTVTTSSTPTSCVTSYLATFKRDHRSTRAHHLQFTVKQKEKKKSLRWGLYNGEVNRSGLYSGDKRHDRGGRRIRKEKTNHLKIITCNFQLVKTIMYIWLFKVISDNFKIIYGHYGGDF